ncbi:tetratricopeptide repeat protein [Achromobacter sp.]|uniref:tetratricopeptide repeat protein n=1 Tax=Achromobacter sp. TaxID=134375 RepID=UPI0028AFB013|nr:tetratricopeptide repeat protein [Achromobacter sp.]
MPFSRLVVIAGVVALMAGCASVKPQSEAEYKQSLADAEKTLAQKDADQAVAQFEEIAQRNPSKGEPWSYIAKIRFDQQKYGQAIVAADETLSRDPDDFVAKTVRAVGGLRVAMQSLADVRADALLAGNARPDAVALAEAMRETLGQDVLFPEGRRPPPRPRQPRKVDPAPAVKPAAGLPAAGAPAAGSPAAGSPAATPSSQQTSSPPAQQPNRAPNPFGDLLTK